MSTERLQQKPPPNPKPLVSIDVAVADDQRVTESGGAPGPAPAHPKDDVQPSDILLAKRARQSHLPVLEDDADVGVEKEHLVTRDGTSDLLFMGILRASAAPTSAPKGEWHEYRIYETTAGKHVFSKVMRHLQEDVDDAYEAEVFDPNPSSTPSRLMRSAREMVRSEPLTWKDAAIHFFGYDPLAKALYRKLDVRFEEQIG